MRIAVVTPYYKETDMQLNRCMSSVNLQTYPVTHVMVADGYPKVLDPLYRFVEHIILPLSHNDAGATPRALGALSAFSRGYDAVAFLDADNWYEPNHIETMVKVIEDSGAAAVVAKRTIYSQDCTFMYVDDVESNGTNMVDTNSWFVTRKAMHLMTTWVVDPAQRLWSDRHFAKSMLSCGLNIVRCEEPTVAYVTKWAWHYKHAGMPIPPDAVWIDVDENGVLVHRKHSEQKEI